MNRILGIIGGGQLGKFLLQYCSTIRLRTYVGDQRSSSNIFFTFSKTRN